MFDTLIVDPIFNLLVFLIAVIPGHNFGLAIIIFTVLVRLIMWPLVKKQLHHSKEIRKLQPEMKRIKKEAAGDRQKQQLMLMELYKERNISPFGSLGTIIIQFVILLGLFFALRNLIQDPQTLVNLTYGPVKDLPWLQEIANGVKRFDETLFGLMDLTRAAVGPQGFYLPAMLLVIGSAFVQYKQSVQLMPNTKDSRTLREILKDSAAGKEADQSEISDAVMRSMRYVIPVMILVFTAGLASALSLYWLVGGIVAIIQQGRVLQQDEEEMEEILDKTVIEKKPTKKVDAEVKQVSKDVKVYTSAAAKKRADAFRKTTKTKTVKKTKGS